MQFRKLEKSESLLYRELRLESLRLDPDAYTTTFKDANAMAKLFFEKVIEDEESARFAMGAFDRELLIGHFCFAYDQPFGLTNTGSLVQMYVKPEFRGRGIGQKLAQAIIGKALAISGVEALLLEVKANNPSAIAVYEKVGFETFDVYPIPMDSSLGTPLIRMRWKNA